MRPNRFFNRFLFALLLLQNSNNLVAQYTTQGVCTQNGNVFTLVGSTASPNVGRFWKNTKIDLTNDFELNFNIALGTTDYSNGLAFLLQGNSRYRFWRSIKYRIRLWNYYESIWNYHSRWRTILRCWSGQ
jgi:hypothetical protein